MAAHVLVADEMAIAARSMAEETFSLFANYLGHYNHQTLIFEARLANWPVCNGLRTRTFPANQFSEMLTECRKLTCIWEARALSASKRMECAFWQNLGRCVAVNQMPDIRAKADVVIWCVTPQSIVPGVSVEIVGWNTVAEIARLPPVCTGLVVGSRQVHNHQVPIEQVRPFANLVNLIMEPDL